MTRHDATHTEDEPLAGKVPVVGKEGFGECHALVWPFCLVPGKMEESFGVTLLGAAGKGPGGLT